MELFRGFKLEGSNEGLIGIAPACEVGLFNGPGQMQLRSTQLEFPNNLANSLTQLVRMAWAHVWILNFWLGLRWEWWVLGVYYFSLGAPLL